MMMTKKNTPKPNIIQNIIGNVSHKHTLKHINAWIGSVWEQNGSEKIVPIHEKDEMIFIVYCLIRNIDGYLETKLLHDIFPNMDVTPRAYRNHSRCGHFI